MSNTRRWRKFMEWLRTTTEEKISISELRELALEWKNKPLTKQEEADEASIRG